MADRRHLVQLLEAVRHGAWAIDLLCDGQWRVQAWVDEERDGNGGKGGKGCGSVGFPLVHGRVSSGWLMNMDSPRNGHSLIRKASGTMGEAITMGISVVDVFV